MTGLCGAIFQHRDVIAQPHIAGIEFGSIFEFAYSVSEFSVLNVVPGKDAMGQCIAHGVAGKLIGILVGSLFFSSSFEFLVGRGGRRGQVMQCLEAGLAAFGDADLHLRIKSTGIGLGYWLRGDDRIVRANGNRELVSLSGRHICR